MRRRRLLALALAVALGAATISSADTAHDALEQARAQALRASQDYRASLAPLLALQTETARRTAETAERRRLLLAGGIVSRLEVEESERAAAAAADALERTRARIAEADTLVAEADAPRLVALLAPAAPGELQTTPALIRHAGAGEWALAMTPRIQRFFAERFGRSLPVSAFGQTSLHDRMGFDHRNALDVAVHPDTPEGQVLMGWLREHGVSFLAFRGPVPGEATGAHLHVGEPSPRLAAITR
jgi:hypothetical protein